MNDTLQYIPANQFLTLSDPQTVTNKIIDCSRNTCLNFPGGGGGSTGFPITLGSTGIGAFSSTSSISGLTLTSATLSGAVAGNPNFTGNPKYTGLSSGTCSVGVALDSGNNLVTTACGGGGGSGITQLNGDVTAGPGSGLQTASISPTGVTAGSYTVSDGSIASCWTVSASGQITGIVPSSCGPTPGALVARNGGGTVARNGGGSVERN